MCFLRLAEFFHNSASPGVFDIYNAERFAEENENEFELGLSVVGGNAGQNDCQKSFKTCKEETVENSRDVQKGTQGFQGTENGGHR